VPSVRAKFKSYCFGCHKPVFKGQVVWMTFADNEKTDYSGVVWRHPECVEAA
jgi:hypothetical protein